MQIIAPGSPEMLPLPFDYRDAAGLQGAVDRAFDAIPADETLDLIILNAGISPAGLVQGHIGGSG
jgi:NAD(P)-dependent dehydrogenase (short-subunit alcohol dehydrogenase family)